MPFLPPNQQRQSTEDNPTQYTTAYLKLTRQGQHRVGVDFVIYTYMNIILITTELYLP